MTLEGIQATVADYTCCQQDTSEGGTDRTYRPDCRFGVSERQQHLHLQQGLLRKPGTASCC
jgi:hypothetical protein